MRIAFNSHKCPWGFTLSLMEIGDPIPAALDWERRGEIEESEPP